MADNSPPQTPVLLQEDVEHLRSRRLISESSRGARQVSHSTLDAISYESSDSGYESNSSNSLVVIPERVESEATVRFLGYDASTATRLWQHYLRNYEPRDPMDFLDQIKGYTKYSSYNTCSHRDSEWRRVGQLMGLADELLEAIMDPEHQGARKTESLQFWALDSMEIRVRLLEDIIRKSKERLDNHNAYRRRVAGAWQPVSGRGQTGTSSTAPRSYAAAVSVGSRTEQSARSSYAAVASAGVPSRPQVSSAAAIPPATPATPDKVLYIGSDVNRFRRSYQPGSSRPFFPAMTCYPPSDFQPLGGIYIYAAEDFEVAAAYARYAMRRAWAAGIACVMKITVRGGFLSSLTTLRLEFGDLRKRIVYQGRKGVDYTEGLEYLYDQDLIIGPICNQPNHTIAGYASWRNMSRADLFWLRNGDRQVMAQQYFFNGRRTLIALSNPANAAIAFLNLSTGAMDPRVSDELLRTVA